MLTRRAIAALSVLAVTAATTAGGAVPVGARSDVDEAETRVEEADARLDRAYDIVDAAVEDRDRIEEELFAALQLYEGTAADLAVANAELDRLTRAVVFADATAAEVDRSIDVQAVAAYMTAVVQIPTVVLDTGSVEDALVVGQAFRASNEELLSDLDRLLVQLAELEALRARHREERDRVEALTRRLAAETDHLEELFGVADAEVAEAFRRARDAAAEQQAALGDLERARVEAAERRRESTTTTTSPPATPATTPEPTVTTGAGDGSTTTTSVGPSLAISQRTRSWTPVVSRHFPADQVENALVVIECESGGDAGAVNPYSGAAGLFQFLPATWAVASVEAGVGDRSPLDGESNIAAAAWLSGYYASRTSDPWRPWTCSEHL